MADDSMIPSTLKRTASWMIDCKVLLEWTWRKGEPWQARRPGGEVTTVILIAEVVCLHSAYNDSAYDVRFLKKDNPHWLLFLIKLRPVGAGIILFQEQSPH